MLTTAIGDALFTKTQQRVLALLYGKPDKSFYTNEIVRWADMGRGTVRRELHRMVSAGLLTVTKAGNQKHYQANQDSPVYTELQYIVRKTFGVADVIRDALTPLDVEVTLAFIYGSVAKGEEKAGSDVDLLVVSDTLAYADVMDALLGTEQALGRTVNPSIYSAADIKKKARQKNAFVVRIMEQPKLWVKGGENDITAIG